MLLNPSFMQAFHHAPLNRTDKIALRVALFISTVLAEAVLATGSLAVTQTLLDYYHPDQLTTNLEIALAVMLGVAGVLLLVDAGAIVRWTMRHFRQPV